MTYQARALLLPLAALLALLLLLVAASDAPARTSNNAKTTFTAAEPGEALLDLTARAPGTNWGKAGRESAVATVTLDGEYKGDVVLFEAYIESLPKPFEAPDPATEQRITKQ